MSKSSALAYRLRPNKAVDRELFLNLLTRLAPQLELESYEYIGLGGPSLEDFRLVHARLDIRKMVCIELEENVHLRQKFNKPVECINCVHSTLEEYLDQKNYSRPVIVWFDYTDPSEIVSQIERFSRTIGEVPLNSILRITLNANPSSLGTPPSNEIGVKLAEMRTNKSVTIQDFRLEKLRVRLGHLFPEGTRAPDLTSKCFGKTILKALQLSVAKASISFKDRNSIWALATHYADGQQMITATLVIAPTDDKQTYDLIRKWSYVSNPLAPLILDLPALSTLERLQMEANDNPKAILGFDLPTSDMGEDPIDSFKKYYRIFPHFARVEY